VPARRQHPTTIHLTVSERDLLRAHSDPATELVTILDGAHVHGPLVSLELNGDQLTEFLDALEQTANLAQNEDAMDRLGQTFARIDAGLAGDTDPGWHKLRPALSRLDLSRKQGQYLAFIHTYTRLHRRAPAESDIQDYFRTTPPSVHEMLKTLQRKHFIVRTAGVARSTRVLLADHEIPELE
jgi:hypothetical protein